VKESARNKKPTVFEAVGLRSLLPCRLMQSYSTER